MRYYNSESEPNGQVLRTVTIVLDDAPPGQGPSREFTPCEVGVAVLNIPDPPVIDITGE